MVYNGIHNLLLAMSVLGCVDQLFLSFADPLCFTPVSLNAFLTRATVKGLTLENVTFVYVSFVLCWCRDGFCEFDLSTAEKSF